MESKRPKKDNSRPVVISWTEDWGFVQQKDRTVCALRLKTVVCRTSSVKQHFETKLQKTFKDEAEKAESITRAVSRYEKQASTLKVFTSP